MLENLRIVFKKDEKTLENLNKVLDILGDDSWSTSNTSCNISSKTLSISDEEKKAHFAKFGFEVPEFKTEIFKEIRNQHVGYYINKANYPIACQWNNKGLCFMGSIQAENYNLVLIKPKWYEDESAKDALRNIRKSVTKLIEFVGDIEFAEKLSEFREELDSLHVSEE